ncbi:MAG TPA: hypothetical protein VE077_13885 [Candidatus Methylomirabilis sp.]|nr:hypothetical protein [Candidatus Methylomirabilis sp.]
MSSNLRVLMLASALLLPASALAAGQDDPHAYCTYVMEQAQAQRDLLRTPAALAGMTQPETGLPLQVVGGASLGLSNLRKAGLTVEAARKNCELYKANLSAQQTIQYAVANLEKEALQNRLALIEQAEKSLDDLMEKTSRMVEAQNATRVMLFSLETTKIKLDADRADTQAKISALYAPALSDRPLKELVAEKQSGEVDQQKILDRLDRQNNWDVALSVGVHQQVNPVAQGAQPYGAVTVMYNLGSRAINKHLDRAAEAYDEWKKVQENDVVRGMEVLRQQLIGNVGVQESKLKSLQEESGRIEKTRQLVVNPDTSAALDFHNQLVASQLLLQIETGDASFRIARMQEYLAKNY